MDCRTIGAALYWAAASVIFAHAAVWAFRHGVHKWGLRCAFRHARMVRDIQKQFLEAPGYTVDLGNREAILPIIKVTFSQGGKNGIVEIQNHIKYSSLLKSLDPSPALGQYVICEEPYLSDDGNWYIYEIEDSTVNWRLIFDDYKSFRKYCAQQERYDFFIDKRSTLTLRSMLLVGETGSGKTYTLYSLVLQLLNWRVRPVLYFADAKRSSLHVLGDRVAPHRNVANPEIHYRKDPKGGPAKAL